VDPARLIVLVFGGTEMKRQLLSILCCAALSMIGAKSATAQTLNLKGRVLDKANMKGVPGATVKVVGASASATTDSEGRFTLTGSLDVHGRFTRIAGEPRIQGGQLFVESIRSGETARIALFNASGESVATADQALKSGWNRIDAFSRGSAGSGNGAAAASIGNRDFVGFARISIGAQTWTKRLLHSGGTASGSWIAVDGMAARGAGAQGSGIGKSGLSKSAAAGQVDVSADKLLKKTVAYASDAADLGDIVLDYPERKTGVGVAPIYGSTVLFDGTKGKTAAAAELQAKWMDWPRYTPSDIKFRIVRDPEFPNDTTGHAALQSCCNTLWGYDDIQAKVGIFSDFQLHVEYIGMGEYDSPFDVAAANPNAADPIASGQPGYINSGVYLASRYEIQIQSWSTDATKIPGNHDMGAVVNDYTPTTNQNKANGVWQSYDITYRGGRFTGTTMTSNPYVSVWWNGVQVHNNRKVNAAASGLSNHSGEEHADTTVYGLKLQSEGRDVRYRNVWIKQLNITNAETNFGY
jgi:hypothetical protein